MREKERAADLPPEKIREMQETEQAVRTYADMVYRLAFSRTGNKSDADDIFQEVFLRYIRKAPQFGSEEHRKAWLIRVTINCAGKFHSSFWQRCTGPLEQEIRFESEEDHSLYQELMRLPDRYRVVLHLFYYEEMSVEEIGRLTGTKLSTVRTQLTRARRRLKEVMEEQENV